MMEVYFACLDFCFSVSGCMVDIQNRFGIPFHSRKVGETGFENHSIMGKEVNWFLENLSIVERKEKLVKDAILRWDDRLNEFLM